VWESGVGGPFRVVGITYSDDRAGELEQEAEHEVQIRTRRV
jgi:hypothetical protein